MGGQDSYSRVVRIKSSFVITEFLSSNSFSFLIANLYGFPVVYLF